MRMMMKCSMDAEVGNARILDGSLPKVVQAIVEEQRPEAVYFTEMEGARTAILFVNINDPSEIPRLAEPWFLAFNAKVEFHPAMSTQDLMKAAQGFEQSVKKYGRR